MFDDEFTTILAIFAGILALIAYISERAKRRIKASGAPIKLKKMPRPEDASLESSSLEEWNFPQPSYDSISQPAPAPEPFTFEAEPSRSDRPLTPAVDGVSKGSNYREIEPSPERAIKRTPSTPNTSQLRFGSKERLRESIIAMTVIGPCRALAPHQEREHY
jgi:hypothetical protein